MMLTFQEDVGEWVGMDLAALVTCVPRDLRGWACVTINNEMLDRQWTLSNMGIKTRGMLA